MRSSNGLRTRVRTFSCSFSFVATMFRCFTVFWFYERFVKHLQKVCEKVCQALRFGRLNHQSSNSNSYGFSALFFHNLPYTFNLNIMNYKYLLYQKFRKGRPNAWPYISRNVFIKISFCYVLFSKVQVTRDVHALTMQI